MERLFEFGIVVAMSLFAIRLGSEGMRRLEVGEKINALTIFSLMAALLVVQVPIVISIVRSTPVIAQAAQNSAAGADDEATSAADPSSRAAEPARHHPRHKNH
jgi:hypothetical protein